MRRLRDDDLLERARAGDDEALEALLRRAAPAILDAVRGRIPPRFRSSLSDEDVVQETFTDVFVDIAGFVPTGDGAFLAWVRTLARNNLRDAVRMLGAGKRGGDRIRVEPGSASSLQSLLAEVVARSRSTPSRKAIRDEEARSLESALGRLPESYRTVVRGYDLEGRSIEEMAGVLKRSPGAVYLLRNRALKRLAELLDPGGES